jgi:DNA adenine methylase
MTRTRYATGAFRPLLKWPGGKAREWDEIAPHMPADVRHFVDPFMGSLAPFALTSFEGRALLNDRHELLVDLHRRAQRRDAELLAGVEELADAWEALSGVAGALLSLFEELVDVRRGVTAGEDLARGLPHTGADWCADRERASRRVRAVLTRFKLGHAHAAVLDAVLDKAVRIPRLERRHARPFTHEELVRQGETAVRAGFYTLVRASEPTATGAAAAARFLFVREYCYGSMFRVNAQGEFNIPYGGASYNDKSFRSRAAQLRARATSAALARATLSCGDFEPFLDGLHAELGPRDLVFADPPYDSDFSTYGRHAFALADHVRLAAALHRLPCPWVLVVKDTPDVRRTYLTGGARLVHEFGKQYGYNVRGRNDRATRHLVVRERGG